MGSDFRSRVLAVVRRIPAGRVATYGDIAELAGAPRAARAVGTIMRDCRDPRVPCHRVIAAGGGLGGYGGSSRGALRATSTLLHLKRDLLRLEGVEVGAARIRHFEAVRWPGRSNHAEKRAPRAGNPGSRARRLTL
jgi:O-6-methylguanine DNA methyltransferase